MILTARDRRLRFLSSRFPPSAPPPATHPRNLAPAGSPSSLPCLSRARPFPITLSCSRARARPYVHTSTSLARSAKGLVHKFAIRENISADGQLRYREREEESEIGERRRRRAARRRRGGSRGTMRATLGKGQGIEKRKKERRARGDERVRPEGRLESSRGRRP